MKFAKRGERRIKQQTFDKEKIFLTKGGKTYNVYDAIQEANVDTDIYEVMKKYHCMQDEAAEIMKEKGGIKAVYGEFTELQKEIQNFADIERIKKRADEMFLNLPVEIRSKYGHDLEKFLKEVQNKNKETGTDTKKETGTETKKEEVNNEPKQ